ncbi:cation acetate symporter [Streptomyces wedmorensis]|uniref:Cation acetate symporter n=1 Tax=Streptomyces wedmorensis TaxID=43759 RepID=A0ABW6IMS2_STRWE
MIAYDRLPGGEESFPVVAVFIVFVVLAMFLGLWLAPERDTPGDFFVSERRLSAVRNGFAMFGDYVSAATVLGTPGLIALTGYDGLVYLTGPIVGCVILMFLLAEPVHSTGRFTIGDSLARRLRPRPVYVAASVSTLVICLLYLIVQMVGAGSIAASILGIPGMVPRRVVVCAVGLLMIMYVLIGGMRATTAMQMIKAVLLLITMASLAVWVLGRFGFDPSALLSAAVDNGGGGEDLLRPGARFGGDHGGFDLLSLELALALGTAGLPHVLMRLGAVSTAVKARKSVQLTIWLTSAVCLMAGVLGFGAAALVGRDAIVADSPAGNTAVPLLADRLGGLPLVSLVSCVAFATILAVVAGVTLAAATSLSHDLYVTVIKRGAASEKREVAVARGAVVAIGVTATTLSLYAQNISISFLAGLAFALAASANLPALLYSTYWPGFTTRGATWSIYGGLASSVLLVLLSPDVTGSPTALLPHLDLAVFPLHNPALVSVPIGFLLGWLGSVRDTRETGGAPYAETEVRALTGAGGRD